MSLHQARRCLADSYLQKAKYVQIRQAMIIVFMLQVIYAAVLRVALKAFDLFERISRKVLNSCDNGNRRH